MRNAQTQHPHLGRNQAANRRASLRFFNIDAVMVVLYSALVAVVHAAGPDGYGPQILRLVGR
jgi:hydroxyacyl-ACP dehydratase HTD2-like protein with hotdog domain